jgi:hypothetical protein
MSGSAIMRSYSALGLTGGNGAAIGLVSQPTGATTPIVYLDGDGLVMSGNTLNADVNNAGTIVADTVYMLGSVLGYTDLTAKVDLELGKIKFTTVVNLPHNLIDFGGAGLKLTPAAPVLLEVDVNNATQNVATSMSLSAGFVLQFTTNPANVDINAGQVQYQHGAANAAVGVIHLAGDGLEVVNAGPPDLQVKTSITDTADAVHHLEVGAAQTLQSVSRPHRVGISALKEVVVVQGANAGPTGVVQFDSTKGLYLASGTPPKLQVQLNTANTLFSVVTGGTYSGGVMTLQRYFLKLGFDGDGLIQIQQGTADTDVTVFTAAACP